MNDLLIIENLAKHYSGFDLEGINITVPAGGIVGLIGSNGAGKTTTIKAALGLINADGGSIKLFGTDTAAVSQNEFSQLKQRIGVVFDSNSFPITVTVSSAGKIMRQACNNWDQAAFDSYCAQFKLDPSKKVQELSRGMSMKLSLACALSHHPDLLILDEATAGLDPLARDEALEILRDFMSEDHGILISSHITSDLEKIADTIVCIDEGKLAFTLEKDAITDLAGIAQCRTADFVKLCASSFFEPGTMRYVKHAYGISVLVPDRFAFAKSFPDIAVDRASIDSYMGLMLKGEKA